MGLQLCLRSLALNTILTLLFLSFESHNLTLKKVVGTTLFSWCKPLYICYFLSCVLTVIWNDILIKGMCGVGDAVTQGAVENLQLR